LYHAISFTPLRWRKKKGTLILTHKLKSPRNQNIASLNDKKITEENIQEKTADTKIESSQKELIIIKPEINKGALQSNQISSFSLSSIKQKKEWERQQTPDEVTQDLPVKPFTEEQLLSFWDIYKNKKFENGDQNIGSLLNISKPVFNTETEIQFSVPSDMNKVELEREFTEFIPYLRKNLHNYDLSIKVIVDEKTEKNFIYTSKEKYERLKEINPAIDLLRKEFDLDI
tara:strand:- start:3345 stop:4031 length:687 start_codon:yes stop_codon:yes gene_type:complete